MGKYLNLKENSENYEGYLEAMESLINPGMILLQTWVTELATDDRGSAGIRLTREQARALGNHLIELADQLFFEDLEKNR